MMTTEDRIIREEIAQMVWDNRYDPDGLIDGILTLRRRYQKTEDGRLQRRSNDEQD